MGVGAGPGLPKACVSHHDHRSSEVHGHGRFHGLSQNTFGARPPGYMASAKSTMRSTKFTTVPLLDSPVLQVGITGEPLSDQAPGRSLVYTDADPGSACPRAESPKFPFFF